MISPLATAFLLLPTLGMSQWPDPEPGTVPIRDPSIVKSTNGTYYLFGTNDLLYTSTCMNGPWVAQDGPLGNPNAIAPDVHYTDDTYYLYWDETIEGENTGSNISVATSPDLSAGSWTVYGLLDLPTNANYNLIDPNLLMVPASGDTPQTYYLSFGSYWDDIFQVNMSDPFTVSSSPTNIEFNNTGTLEYGSNPSEGSYQFSWTIEDVTYYYLFFSSGWTLVTEIVIPAGDEYKIMVCRSLTPTGPFKDADGKNCLTDNGGTLVLGSHDYVYAPGGQGVFVDPEVDGGSVILYYHYVPNSTNEATPATFGWNVLDFDDDAWPYVTNLSTALTC